MISFNQYWNGNACAKITRDKVPEALLKKDKFYHPDWSISRWNLAFRLYYDGMATIKALRDSSPQSGLADSASVVRERSRIGQLMVKDLHDAAETGWGMGVSDLREGFHHLAANNGSWTDTNVKTYAGPLGRIHGLGPSCTTVQCAANFLEAYEARVKEIGEKLKLMKAGLSRTERLLQRVKNSNTVGTGEWKEFGDALGEVKTWSERIERGLWVLRLTRDPHSTSSEALELGEEALGAAAKCLSAVALIRDTVTLYNSSLSSGLSPQESVGLLASHASIEGTGIAAGFVEGTGTVVGGMAVLLAVYAKALTMIPDIHRQFTDIAQRQNFLAAQLGVDLRPWQRH